MRKISGSTCGVIILAAGQGKRMRSTLPKVLHEVSGRPLLFHILDRVKETRPAASIVIVVGQGRELVESRVRESSTYKDLPITFVHQAEQKGTGHAARCAMDSDWGEKRVQEKASVLVLPGDLPLLSQDLVAEMLEPLPKTAALRLLTTVLPDPTGYGRVVRKGKKGAVLRIVEEKDASSREKAIQEVAASIYMFQAAFLKSALQRLSNRNAQGEYYLTDLVAAAAKAKKRIDVLEWKQHEDLRGVNDPWELALAQRMMTERQLQTLGRSGVKFLDPWSTYVDATATIAPGAVIHAGVHLRGATSIAEGAVIGPNAVLTDTLVETEANVKTGTVAENAVIRAGAQIGPYAHLRPESEVGPKAKIGNFVELKKTRIGAETSVAHLSYLGDADVGERVNIGCGFITCNFDGRVIDGKRKHRTIIEDDVFMGSDCQCVAPVKVGKGAFVASGSTITEDVERDALAIARSRQVNKSGYAKKLRDQK